MIKFKGNHANRVLNWHSWLNWRKSADFEFSDTCSTCTLHTLCLGLGLGSHCTYKYYKCYVSSKLQIFRIIIWIYFYHSIELQKIIVGRSQSPTSMQAGESSIMTFYTYLYLKYLFLKNTHLWMFPRFLSKFLVVSRKTILLRCDSF